MSKIRKRVLLAEQRRKGKKFDSKKEFAIYHTYVVDLLTYALWDYCLIWHFRDRQIDTKCNVRIFQPLMWKAVNQYHSAHEEELLEEVCENLIHETDHDIDSKAIGDCVRGVAEKIFKGENFVKEFFVFCSFLVELAYYCVSFDQVKHVSTIVSSIATVYESFLKRRFAVFGGWHALCRYAVQYLTYRKESEGKEEDL